MGVQIMIALLLAIVAIVVSLDIRAKYFEFELPPPYPGFVESTTAFTESVAGLKNTDGAAAFLLDRVDKLMGIYSDSVARMDAKANVILGFLGAGVGVLSVVQGTGEHAPSVTPLLVVGLACIFGALAASLRALRVPISQTPSLEPFCIGKTLEGADAKEKIAARLAHAYLVLQRDGLKSLMLKGTAVRMAQFLFAIGALAFTLNLVLPSTEQKPPPPGTKCSVAKLAPLSVLCSQQASSSG